jgi:hypothetical protein
MKPVGKACLSESCVRKQELSLLKTTGKQISKKYPPTQTLTWIFENMCAHVFFMSVDVLTAFEQIDK